MDPALAPNLRKAVLGWLTAPGVARGAVRVDGLAEGRPFSARAVRTGDRVDVEGLPPGPLDALHIEPLWLASDGTTPLSWEAAKTWAAWRGPVALSDREGAVHALGWMDDATGTWRWLGPGADGTPQAHDLEAWLSAWVARDGAPPELHRLTFGGPAPTDPGGVTAPSLPPRFSLPASAPEAEAPGGDPDEEAPPPPRYAVAPAPGFPGRFAILDRRTGRTMRGAASAESLAPRVDRLNAMEAQLDDLTALGI